MKGAKVKYENLGRTLREGRQAQGYSLSTACMMLGLASVSYLSRCELGDSNFPVGRLKRACQLYKLPTRVVVENAAEDYRNALTKLLKDRA